MLEKIPTEGDPLQPGRLAAMLFQKKRKQMEFGRDCRDRSGRSRCRRRLICLVRGPIQFYGTIHERKSKCC